MKITKYLTIGILFIGMTALMGCKKDYITKKDADSKYVQQGTNNNTVQSETFTVYSYDWNGSSSSGYWYYDYYTSKVNLSGAVLLYMYNGTQYISISTTAYAPNFEEGIGFAYDTSTGMLEVQHYSTSGSSLSNPGMEKFKIVTVPSSGMKAHPNVNLSDYKEVSKTFNLK